MVLGGVGAAGGLAMGGVGLAQSIESKNELGTIQASIGLGLGLAGVGAGRYANRKSSSSTMSVNDLPNDSYFTSPEYLQYTSAKQLERQAATVQPPKRHIYFTNDFTEPEHVSTYVENPIMAAEWMQDPLAQKKR